MLDDIGFSGTLASGGLARAAYLAALQVVGAGLASNALTESSKGRIIERVLAWAIDGNEIRYLGTNGFAVEKLLDLTVQQQRIKGGINRGINPCHFRPRP